MKISIIIPVYKVENYIADCLRSVFAQTYEGEIECILVDDCGCDNSMHIAEQLIGQYNGGIQFVILHHGYNRGLSAARNTGMDAAHGDYICFLDSDDEITPNCIKELTDPLKNTQCDVVIGGIKTIGDDHLQVFLKLKLDNTELNENEIGRSYLTRSWNMMAQAKLYNINFLKREHLSFKEGLIHEDELWSFQIACLAKKICIVNSNVYLYYVRCNGITGNQTLFKKMMVFKVIVHEMALFLKNRRIKNRYMYVFMHHYLYTVLKYFSNDYNNFKDSYSYMVSVTRFPLIIRLKSNGKSIRLQIRDLHYFMPRKIGVIWEYYLLRMVG